MPLAKTPLRERCSRWFADNPRGSAIGAALYRAGAQAKAISAGFHGAPVSSLTRPFWWLALGCLVGIALILVSIEPQKLAPAEVGTVVLASE